MGNYGRAKLDVHWCDSGHIAWGPSWKHSGESRRPPSRTSQTTAHRPGRPRSTPTALVADKAYSARAHRQLLRERGITTVIPERADQIAHRHRHGSTGGSPVTFDAETYKRRNVVERAFTHIK